MTDKYTPTFTVDGFDVAYTGESFTVSETLESVIADISNTIVAAREERMKGALRSLGWIAPEDIAAHDREVAARALREAAALWGTERGPEMLNGKQWLRDRAAAIGSGEL